MGLGTRRSNSTVIGCERITKPHPVGGLTPNSPWCCEFSLPGGCWKTDTLILGATRATEQHGQPESFSS
ncbi:hypothetical protein E2C01_018591 [Portunus trituberculatus]|uniref:Uncharacterized protein n=1 Tax=Portunus trituberculatus TaxID=210409 RepID=A0A5B7DXG2_PORTR|nr:hypothetical protein [Portunus trituberculatus]